MLPEAESRPSASNKKLYINNVRTRKSGGSTVLYQWEIKYKLFFFLREKEEPPNIKKNNNKQIKITRPRDSIFRFLVLVINCVLFFFISLSLSNTYIYEKEEEESERELINIEYLQFP